MRTVPKSRRNPQYNSDVLARTLPGAGVSYRHEPALGGFRRVQPDSPNGGWRHPSFRGYADYMAGDEFRDALLRLELQAEAEPTAVMCAETLWWRCHRRMIADALVARGRPVLHLGVGAEPVVHELTRFAVVDAGGRITYPPAPGDESA